MKPSRFLHCTKTSHDLVAYTYHWKDIFYLWVQNPIKALTLNHLFRFGLTRSTNCKNWQSQSTHKLAETIMHILLSSFLTIEIYNENLNFYLLLRWQLWHLSGHSFLCNTSTTKPFSIWWSWLHGWHSAIMPCHKLSSNIKAFTSRSFLMIWLIVFLDSPSFPNYLSILCLLYLINPSYLCFYRSYPYSLKPSKTRLKQTPTISSRTIFPMKLNTILGAKIKHLGYPTQITLQ